MRSHDLLLPHSLRALHGIIQPIINARCMCRVRARVGGLTQHTVYRASQMVTTHCVTATDPVNHRSHRQDSVSAPRMHIAARTEPAKLRVGDTSRTQGRMRRHSSRASLCLREKVSLSHRSCDARAGHTTTVNAPFDKCGVRHALD